MREIPKTLKLGGRTWHVIRVGKRKWFGSTSGTKCTIKLSERCVTQEELWHTFWHELIHAICFTMGWSKLNDDEDKIDAMASLLKQATESFK